MENYDLFLLEQSIDGELDLIFFNFKIKIIKISITSFSSLLLNISKTDSKICQVFPSFSSPIMYIEPFLGSREFTFYSVLNKGEYFIQPNQREYFNQFMSMINLS